MHIPSDTQLTEISVFTDAIVSILLNATVIIGDLNYHSFRWITMLLYHAMNVVEARILQ